MSMDKVVLIDAHNAIWRACVTWGPPVPHLLCQPCQNNKHSNKMHCACGAMWDQDHDFCYGDKYGFVYNFFRNLRPLIEQFQPDKCFFALEGHPQFRYELYADYKANRIVKQASRQEANAKFLQAKDMILPLMRHLPITLCRTAHYEADDLIGALCHNMQAEDLTVISTDSDYIQLLQRGYSRIRIYNPIKKEMMEAPPYVYVMWKSLAGDKSDHIPSLLKPKKALQTATQPELFAKFMSVPENFSNFQINRQLIEFHPVPEEEISLQEGARNFAYLLQAFEQMQFPSLTNAKSWQTFCQTFQCLKY